MSFLKRAEALSDEDGGLLRRSTLAVRTALADVAVTRDELDQIAQQLRKREHERTAVLQAPPGEPAHVPKTWQEAGISAPTADLGPLIDQAELAALDSQSVTDNTAFLTRVRGIRPGLAAPVLFFEALGRNLKTPAALLMREPRRETLAAYATKDLSRETAAALRIPHRYARSIGMAERGEIATLGAQELDEFERFFAPGDIQGVTGLTFIPLTRSDQVVAVVLIVDTGTGAGVAAARLLADTPLDLFDPRTRLLSALASAPAGTTEQLMHKAQGLKRATLVKLELDKLIERFVEHHTMAVAARVMEDVLVHAELTVAPAAQGAVVAGRLYVAMAATGDAELMGHQVAMAVGRELGLVADEVPPVQAAAYPEEVKDLRGFFD